jgi:hypothetical protein
VVDITGAVLSCDAKITGGTPIAAATYFIDDGPGGLARARFTSAQTAGLTAGKRYNYDGRLVMLDGRRLTIGSGSFMAVAAATPTP